MLECCVCLQVFNVCTSPIVQKAWDLGQPLAVHGLVYDIADGILKVVLRGTVTVPVYSTT